MYSCWLKASIPISLELGNISPLGNPFVLPLIQHWSIANQKKTSKWIFSSGHREKKGKSWMIAWQNPLCCWPMIEGINYIIVHSYCITYVIIVTALRICFLSCSYWSGMELHTTSSSVFLSLHSFVNLKLLSLETLVLDRRVHDVVGYQRTQQLWLHHGHSVTLLVWP